MFYLYTIKNVTDSKVYIGQTVRPERRWSQHKVYAQHVLPIQYIHRAIAKHGIENFVFEIIAVCKTQENADYVEEELIKQYDSRNKDKGYNVAPGGKHAWNVGLPSELQPMFGRHHSEESKKKSSSSNTGKKKPHSRQWSSKISKIMVGRQITWAQKISEAQAKFTISTEREIFAKYNKGIPTKILKEEYDCSLTTVYSIIRRRRKYDT
jgi:group I intron endonuclease